MLAQTERNLTGLSSRLVRGTLAPVRWIVAMMTVGFVVVLFEVIGLIDDALPEDEKLKDWI
jgi:hypothetical protein